MDCPFPGLVHFSCVHPTGSILQSNRVIVHLLCILRAGLCPFPSCLVSFFFQMRVPIIVIVHHMGRFV